MKRLPVIIGLVVILSVAFAFAYKMNQSTDVPKDAKWSERMAQSIMKRNPKSWQIDFREKPKWSYTHGLVLQSMLRLWEKTGEQKYFDYAESYVDKMVHEDGSIETYDITDFNIDKICPGRVLISVYEETDNPKYKKAIELLRKQLDWQPRTTDGGFWHKNRYPWQMWLDGLFMGAPFYTEYGLKFDEPEALDDVTSQLILMEQHARDEKTGLLYHGWDQSGLQRWSDPETGLSQHFWGRGMGWYSMALVDVLDQLPKDHENREKVEGILQRLVEALSAYQDEETGLWYQVVDQGDREGNYLEASASCMYVYAMAKGVNLGVLDKKYKKLAEKGFNGITEELMKVDPKTGVLELTQVCAVAGLGGNPYRDGSYEYYIGEEIRSDDPKATGPFIFASLELNK